MTEDESTCMAGRFEFSMKEEALGDFIGVYGGIEALGGV